MAKESKHVRAFSQNHLKPGESIVCSANGYIGEMMGSGDKTQHNGVLLVTGERVAFYRKGLLGEVLETIPLKSVTSIERKSLLGHRTINLHTSHDSLEFKISDKQAEQLLLDAIEAGRSAGAAPAQPTGDHLETLKKLAELKEAGVISEEDFAAKKADLLSKL
ncbi:MAG: hypothetical protein HKN10_04900 [Myxococcales bacterium]|nr:hypothetical protein [Myxococcales bacterium]